jgi:hypothetical protein
LGSTASLRCSAHVTCAMTVMSPSDVVLLEDPTVDRIAGKVGT